MLAASGDFLEALQWLEARIESLDKLNMGTVARAAFVNMLVHNQLLFDCFARSVTAGLEQLRPSFVDYQYEHPRTLTVGRVLEAWQRVQAAGHTEQRLSERQFRGMMKSDFRITGEFTENLQRLFDVYALDSDTVSITRLFQGLIMCMGATLEEKADLLMATCEIVSSRRAMAASNAARRRPGRDTILLDKKKLLALVEATEIAAGAGAEDVNVLLASLDRDGDGDVSLQEFKLACSQDPGIMECFGRLFGVETEGSSDAGMCACACLSVLCQCVCGSKSHTVGALRPFAPAHTSSL